LGWVEIPNGEKMEYWNSGIMGTEGKEKGRLETEKRRNNGMMEYWNNGRMSIG